MVSGIATARSSENVDTFGCSLGKLDTDRQVQGCGITFYRKGSDTAAPGPVATSGNNKGFLVGVSLKGRHRRRIFNEHHSTVQDFDENAIYIRDLADDYRADLSGTFNFILLEISRTALTEIAEHSDAKSVGELTRILAEPDPVLGSLARALFAAGDAEQGASALFIDQISVAMGMHLVQKYGNGDTGLVEKRRSLSRRNEARAKDIIRERLTGDISVDELASACNLSRGTFIRAFRETTGKTPHQWLTQQRLEQARALLLTSQMSLSEISTACGFADQSHFTRVFSTAIGAPPGTWRRTRMS